MRDFELLAELEAEAELRRHAEEVRLTMAMEERVSSGRWMKAPRTHTCDKPRMVGEGPELKLDHVWRCRCRRRYRWTSEGWKPGALTREFPEGRHFRLRVLVGLVLILGMMALLVGPIVLAFAVHLNWLLAYAVYFIVMIITGYVVEDRRTVR